MGGIVSSIFGMGQQYEAPDPIKYDPMPTRAGGGGSRVRIRAQIRTAQDKGAAGDERHIADQPAWRQWKFGKFRRLWKFRARPAGAGVVVFFSKLAQQAQREWGSGALGLPSGVQGRRPVQVWAAAQWSMA